MQPSTGLTKSHNMVQKYLETLHLLEDFDIITSCNGLKINESNLPGIFFVPCQKN